MRGPKRSLGTLRLGFPIARLWLAVLSKNYEIKKIGVNPIFLIAMFNVLAAFDEDQLSVFGKFASLKLELGGGFLHFHGQIL